MRKKEFSYLQFNDDSMVFAKDQYTKEQALQIAKEECEEFENRTLDDVKEGYVKYKFDPGYCQEEWGTNGAYFGCEKGARGSFPVWVIS